MESGASYSSHFQAHQMGTSCTESVWDVPSQTLWIHPSFAPHSITSSAVASSVGGTVEAERVRPAKSCRPLEFLFLVADIPDADYFARCVLDRVITGHVQLAEDVDFAIESLTFVNIHYRFSLRIQDGPKRPAVYAARHIGGYADIIITSLYEKRGRAAGFSLDLVDNREFVVHLG